MHSVDHMTSYMGVKSWVEARFTGIASRPTDDGIRFHVAGRVATLYFRMLGGYSVVDVGQDRRYELRDSISSVPDLPAAMRPISVWISTGLRLRQM